MGSKHILIPVMIFLLEGMPFFNVTPTGNIWYNLLFFNFPMPPDLSSLGWFGMLTTALLVVFVYWEVWFGVLLLKLVGMIGILVSIMSIPFSMMAAFPILMIPQTILILILVYGIITSIHIAGSGVEPKE